MSETSEQGAVPRGPFDDLPSGGQALALIDMGSGLLSTLPDRAFDDLLLITLRTRPREVERAIREHGGDPATAGLVSVDTSDSPYDGPLRLVRSVRPNDLTGLSIAVSEGLKRLDPGDGWVVLDNLSILLIYTGIGPMTRFFHLMTGYVRNLPARGVYAMARDAVKEGTYNQFRQFCDVEIDLR